MTHPFTQTTIYTVFDAVNDSLFGNYSDFDQALSEALTEAKDNSTDTGYHQFQGEEGRWDITGYDKYSDELCTFYIIYQSTVYGLAKGAA